MDYQRAGLHEFSFPSDALDYMSTCLSDLHGWPM